MSDLAFLSFRLPKRSAIGSRPSPTAATRAFVETGEAIKALPPELRDRRSEIDWRGLVRLRDVMVHR
jgi:uncharacterized protein with HEPN domain